jgi:hypothetical protein
MTSWYAATTTINQITQPVACLLQLTLLPLLLLHSTSGIGRTSRCTPTTRRWRVWSTSTSTPSPRSTCASPRSCSSITAASRPRTPSSTSPRRARPVRQHT